MYQEALQIPNQVRDDGSGIRVNLTESLEVTQWLSRVSVNSSKQSFSYPPYDHATLYQSSQPDDYVKPH